MRRELIFMLFIAALAVVAVLTYQEQSRPADKLQTIVIGQTKLKVELAVSAEQKIKGLSGREELPDSRGMLFVFEQPDFHGFWMKDMRFAVDIIWFSQDKEVVDIATNVKPESYPSVFKPSRPAQYVLEAKAGFAERHGVRVGDRVEF